MLKSVIIQVKKMTCESKLDFIPMQIEDSKPACSKNEDVDALTVLIEERTA